MVLVVLQVHLVSEHIWCDDYLVRSFYLKNLQTNETRTVTQFHFLTWTHLSVPPSMKALLDFRRFVSPSPPNPPSPQHTATVPQAAGYLSCSGALAFFGSGGYISLILCTDCTETSSVKQGVVATYL